jgi:hypothetical protein
MIMRLNLNETRIKPLPPPDRKRPDCPGRPQLADSEAMVGIL